MAINCLRDSSSLTKWSGIKNVSKGRKAIIVRQKTRAIEAQVRAARRAQARNWNKPIPVRMPSAISTEGTVAINRNATVWLWYRYFP